MKNSPTKPAYLEAEEFSAENNLVIDNFPAPNELLIAARARAIREWKFREMAAGRLLPHNELTDRQERAAYGTSSIRRRFKTLEI